MNSTPPAVAPRPSLDGLRQAIKRERPRLQSYLPDGLSIDRFEALLERQVRNNPRLAECSIHNVLREISDAATSGLPIDGQFSTLIVRDSKRGPPKCTWDPTYRGLIAQALASGFVVDVQSGVVRSNDFFEFNEGSAPSLVHRRTLLPNWGDVIAELGDGQAQHGRPRFRILTAGDIAKIRAMSPAGDRGAWGHWADMMARKSAIRRLLHRLPAGTVRLSAPMEITAAPDEPARVIAPIAEHAQGAPVRYRPMKKTRSSAPRLSDCTMPEGPRRSRSPGRHRSPSTAARRARAATVEATHRSSRKVFRRRA